MALEAQGNPGNNRNFISASLAITDEGSQAQGAQVLTTKGAIKKPLSSAKTMWAPSRAAFFLPRGQSLTVRQQTVVGVRERRQRKKGEGLPATGAATPTNPDPVVMLVVGLLAAAPMADGQISSTNRTSSQDNIGADRCPIRFELVRRDGKRDKRNRSLLELCPSTDLPRSRPEAELLPPEGKSTGRENRWTAPPCLNCRTACNGSSKSNLTDTVPWRSNLIAAPAYFCVLNNLDANCLIPGQGISSVPVHFG